MNNVQLIGRLTADPENKTAQSGTTVARFTLAVDRRRKDDGADFVRCVCFGKTADTLCQYVTKGRKIGITGRIQTGSYDDKDGRKVYTTDVIVDSFDFCDSRSGEAENASRRPQEAAETPERANMRRPAQKAVQSTLDGFMDIPEGIDEELPFT